MGWSSSSSPHAPPSPSSSQVHNTDHAKWLPARLFIRRFNWTKFLFCHKRSPRIDVLFGPSTATYPGVCLSSVVHRLLRYSWIAVTYSWTYFKVIKWSLRIISGCFKKVLIQIFRVGKVIENIDQGKVQFKSIINIMCKWPYDKRDHKVEQRKKEPAAAILNIGIPTNLSWTLFWDSGPVIPNHHFHRRQ